MSEWRGWGFGLGLRGWRVLALASFVGASSLSCGPHKPWALGPAPQPAPNSNTAPTVPDEAEPNYTLAQGSVRLLGTLKTTLQIDAYVPTDVPQVADYVDDLTALLTAYQRASHGKLRFRLLEPNTDALREQAKQDGLSEQVFEETGANPADERVGIAQGYFGLVFKYGAEKTVIPQLPSDSSNGLEFWVTNKIREIRDKGDGIKHRIGVVAGNGELGLSDTNLVPNAAGNKRPSLQGILTQAFPFYQIEEVGLKGGNSPIDPELVGLIVTQPQKDYTAAELRRIDDFMMLGDKALVVYASAVNIKPGDPSLLATLSTHGLDTLLDGYGIHMNRDAVFDSGAQFKIQVQLKSGQTAWLRHCGMPNVVNSLATRDRPPLDNDFAVFFRMEELPFPFASSLELARDKQPADVKLEAVARSTPDAWVERSDIVDMKLREQWKARGLTEERILAAYAQGKLQSAFAGQPGAAPNGPVRALRSSRVLVMSSSLFLTNPFAYAGNSPSDPSGGDTELLMLAQPYTKNLTNMILSIKNALDWMSNDDDLIALSATFTRPSRHSHRHRSPRN